MKLGLIILSKVLLRCFIRWFEAMVNCDIVSRLCVTILDVVLSVLTLVDKLTGLWFTLVFFLYCPLSIVTWVNLIEEHYLACV